MVVARSPFPQNRANSLFLEHQRLGLVDVLGGLNVAISIAAKKANLTSYRTIALPEQKEFFEKLVEDLNTEAKTYFAKQKLGDNYLYFEELNDLIKQKGIIARMQVDHSQELRIIYRKSKSLERNRRNFEERQNEYKQNLDNKLE